MFSSIKNCDQERNNGRSILARKHVTQRKEVSNRTMETFQLENFLELLIHRRIERHTLAPAKIQSFRCNGLALPSFTLCA